MSVVFGKKLKELRLKKHYTEKQLADLLCVTLETYKEFESGEIEPSINRTYLLTDIFNINIISLFEYEE